MHNFDEPGADKRVRLASTSISIYHPQIITPPPAPFSDPRLEYFRLQPQNILGMGVWGVVSVEFAMSRQPTLFSQATKSVIQSEDGKHVSLSHRENNRAMNRYVAGPCWMSVMYPIQGWVTWPGYTPASECWMCAHRRRGSSQDSSRVNCFYFISMTHIRCFVPKHILAGY